MSITFNDKTSVSIVLVLQICMMIYLSIAATIFSHEDNSNKKGFIYNFLKNVTFWKVVTLSMTIILSFAIQLGLIDYKNPQNIVRFEGISICLAFAFWILLFLTRNKLNLKEGTKQRLTEGVIGFSTFIGMIFLLHRGMGMQGSIITKNLFYGFSVLFIIYNFLMFIATQSDDMKPEGRKEWLKTNSLNFMMLFILISIFVMYFKSSSYNTTNLELNNNNNDNNNNNNNYNKRNI
jgi:hypothetical protein